MEHEKIDKLFSDILHELRLIFALVFLNMIMFMVLLFITYLILINQYENCCNHTNDFCNIIHTTTNQNYYKNKNNGSLL